MKSEWRGARLDSPLWGLKAFTSWVFNEWSTSFNLGGQRGSSHHQKPENATTNQKTEPKDTWYHKYAPHQNNPCCLPTLSLCPVLLEDVLLTTGQMSFSLLSYCCGVFWFVVFCDLNPLVQTSFIHLPVTQNKVLIKLVIFTKVLCLDTTVQL